MCVCVCDGWVGVNVCVGRICLCGYFYVWSYLFLWVFLCVCVGGGEVCVCLGSVTGVFI